MLWWRKPRAAVRKASQKNKGVYFRFEVGIIYT